MRSLSSPSLFFFLNLAVASCVAVWFGAIGCFGPSLGELRCGEDMNCPDGRSCHPDGICRIGDAVDSGIVGSALLTGLEISPLSEAELGFSPTVQSYQSALSILNQSVVVTAAAPPGASITLGSVPLTSGVASDPIALPRDGATLTIAVSQAGRSDSIYTVVLTRDAEVTSAAFVKASNNGPMAGFSGDQFGTALAVSGDTLVVGAELEDSGSDPNDEEVANSGAVYVYRRTTQGWTFEAMLKSPDPDVGDVFGRAIAIDGDTLAVGIPLEDSSSVGLNGEMTNDDSANSGAVMVFARSGAAWTLESYIKASNTGAADQFGASLALENGLLAVGAIGEDSSSRGLMHVDNDDGINSGAVYLFRRDGDTWNQELVLKSSNSDPNDTFGSQISLSDDSLAVAALGEDSGRDGVGPFEFDESAPSAGAVYIFRRNGMLWSQEAYIKSTNSDTSDAFGSSVALDGDRLVVGAYLEDSSSIGIGGAQDNDDAGSSGAAYVYGRSGTTWFVDEYIKASNPEVGDSFGFGVALKGDLMFVGAILEDSAAPGIDMGQQDNGAPNAGAGYLFEQTDNGWVQRHYFKSSAPDSGDSFSRRIVFSQNGLFVSASNDDSDGGGVGGDPANNDSRDSGAVFVFE